MLVSYAFGAGLPASGRCVTTKSELSRATRGSSGDVACYVVEVCPRMLVEPPGAHVRDQPRRRARASAPEAVTGLRAGLGTRRVHRAWFTTVRRPAAGTRRHAAAAARSLAPGARRRHRSHLPAVPARPRRRRPPPAPAAAGALARRRAGRPGVSVAGDPGASANSTARLATAVARHDLAGPQGAVPAGVPLGDRAGRVGLCVVARLTAAAVLPAADDDHPRRQRPPDRPACRGDQNREPVLDHPGAQGRRRRGGGHRGSRLLPPPRGRSDRHRCGRPPTTCSAGATFKGPRR